MGAGAAQADMFRISWLKRRVAAASMVVDRVDTVHLSALPGAAQADLREPKPPPKPRSVSIANDGIIRAPVATVTAACGLTGASVTTGTRPMCDMNHI
jgi:hypothetical protein